MRFLLVTLCLSGASVAREVTSPFVVLPPFLRTGSSNSILVTPIKTNSENVDIALTVKGISRNSRRPLFTQNLKAKKAGTTHVITFDLNSQLENAEVVVSVKGHADFISEIRIRPDLAALHLHTDKNIYRAGETVNIRALPLNNAGNVFTGPLDIALVNPDGFELSRHRLTASDGFTSTRFELPLHLFFGNWRILARPSGFRDPDLTYDTSFAVRDYDLPPYQLRVRVAEDDPLDKMNVTVEASYFHGAAVDGTLLLFCSPHSKNQSVKTHRLLQTEIANGQWNGFLDVRECFDALRHPARLTVEARDRGTGGRGETSIEFDPLRPGFDVVPMRPTFDAGTKIMLFVTYALGMSDSTALKVEFTCLGSERTLNRKDMEVSIGEVVKFDLPPNWNNCSVIMLQAHRPSVSGEKSRVRTLMIPSMAPADVSWITLKYPKTAYKVGETLDVSVPKTEARRLNYLVLCNSHSVPTAGRVRDDGEISVALTTAMLGRCVLFVYTAHLRPNADMLLFYVKDNCAASVFSSHREMKPGQNVTLTLNGDPYGTALVKAIDDRLNFIPGKAEPVKVRNWDFGMFDRTDAVGSTSHFQARLANFVNVKALRAMIEKKCKYAGRDFKRRFGTCPELKVTSSCISNHCVKWLEEMCRNPPPPTISMICDERNKAKCRAPQVVQSSMPIFMMKASTKTELLRPDEAFLSDVPDLHEDPGSEIRENFQEVWLFDSYALGASGTTSVTSKAPDSIGRWAVSSAFWTPGQQELCPAPGVSILSKKKAFLQVSIPRNVYVNETITVKISVSAVVEQETKYSICMSELSRKVCGDLGSLGQYGRPTYTRVVVSKEQPTDTKTFTIRFLATGISSVLFRLRKEESFPGKHHCEVGEIMDAVRLQMFIARRAETEEHTKRLILNAEKPLAAVAMNDAMQEDNHIPVKNILEVSEHRSLQDPTAVVTQVTANVHDTDRVYSFSIDLSKFLATEPAVEPTNRAKRGALDYGNTFMSDVLKQLSVELYQFRKARMIEKADVRSLEYAENRIGILVSDLLRFSDCTNDMACGFAEYGRPTEKENRSPLLTSLAASLLCEASADEQLVCGSVRFLLDIISSRAKSFIDLHDMIDIETETDKQWFMNALLLQVSKDCGAYQCIKNDSSWMELYKDFYNLDENYRFDDRSIAAVAFMGTNATAEIMRIKMTDSMDKNALPYWTAGNSHQRLKSKMSSFDRMSFYRRIKSGDILVNSLGVLAFISAGAEGRGIDWDPLANWIYEQQSEDGSYESALDTYFASRALYEYRARKVEFETGGDLQVTVACATCDTRTVNVTEMASEIYLPNHVRNFTLTTKGRGKVKAGIRILLTKRQRSRRGLTLDDYYPVRISIEQQNVASGIIKQTVCLQVMSPMLGRVEMTHGFFTGYTSKPGNIDVLSNSSHVRLHSLPSISSYAAHFILEGLKSRVIQCYEVGVSEPGHSHEPVHLAPVAIVARHPINDVVGLVLISHPDQPRHRRSAVAPVPLKTGSQWKRYPRNIVDESIDTICFQGGMCSCAETTCGVQCGMCRRDTSEDLQRRIEEKKTFAVQIRVQSTEQVLVGSSFYKHIESEVREKKGDGSGVVAERMSIWLRECNPRCLPAAGIRKGDKFFLLGDIDALMNDADGRQHYVVRDMDRLEYANGDCVAWAKLLLLT